MTARRDELTDAAADAAIEQACRLLRLPAIRDRHGEIAAAAARQQAGYKEFLTELLPLACDGRVAPAGVGCSGLARRGAELLFQVFTERGEKASIAIASNAAFSEGTSAFTDPRLCGAIVARLTCDGHIIQTGSRSCRLRTAAARRQPAPGPSPQERTDPS